jgi:hypothetical protein
VTAFLPATGLAGSAVNSAPAKAKAKPAGRKWRPAGIGIDREAIAASI